MTNKKIKRYEVDLFNPVEEYFSALGYDVHGEVNDCDMTASKDDELVIIELKLTLNVDLLVQATKRQRLTEQVYIAIPKPNYSLRTKKWRDVCHLLRRLELGLFVVSFQEDNAQISIIHEPCPFNRMKSYKLSKKKRAQLVAEINGRQVNYNIGGSHQTKIMTAYKENCIHIACCLERFGPLSPKSLRELGTGDKTFTILNNNYYDWFERISRGMYGITEKGISEFRENIEIAVHYEQLISEKKRDY